MDVSIVVPCYNEENVVEIFIRELNLIFKNMSETSFEVILIDDGSQDSTLAQIKQMSNVDKRIKYISFSRNFGKEAAIYAGLCKAKGDFVVIMDVDLQDPPSLLPEMYNMLKNGLYDSVATRRVNRDGEPIIRSFFARLFYQIMNKISKTELVDGARDYRMMNRKFVNAILELKEYNRFSKGLFGWVGFKTKWIEYENIERVAGETKWSFWSLLLYAIEGIVAFSTVPLIISTIIGLTCFIFSLIGIFFIVIRKVMFDDPVQGWASTISLVLFLGGIQLMCLGILGQYLAKTYLETKKRPVYVIGETNI